MKIRLHKPKQGLWSIALLLFILGLIGTYIPGLGSLSFYLLVASSALLILGTWVI
jgi:hypothetical protein